MPLVSEAELSGDWLDLREGEKEELLESIDPDWKDHWHHPYHGLKYYGPTQREVRDYIKESR